jgi:hypothetical protein
MDVLYEARILSNVNCKGIINNSLTYITWLLSSSGKNIDYRDEAYLIQKALKISETTPPI